MRLLINKPIVAGPVPATQDLFIANHNNKKRYIMKLQYLTKKDYLAKRLDINIYNSFVKQYNSTEDLNKKKEVHNDFRNFVNFSLNKRLEIIRG